MPPLQNILKNYSFTITKQFIFYKEDEL